MANALAVARHRSRRWAWISTEPGAALRDTAGVPGRMERVDAGQPFTVIVDYAHTADALGRCSRSCGPLTEGRLIVVFGSAGERDATKRAPMGRVAAELADAWSSPTRTRASRTPAPSTSRSRRARATAGARDGETLWVIDDRREAIGHAMGMARAGDVMLLAGKGHEAQHRLRTEEATVG